jgi:ribosomal protein L16/L10AE
MGKGKGKPTKWISPVSKNCVLSEFILIKKKQNLSLKKLKLSLKALKNKLSVKLKICRILY